MKNPVVERKLKPREWRGLLWFLLIVIVAFAFTAFLAVSFMSDPRVKQCDRCGEVVGIIGGHLPGQCTICDCGGRLYTVRTMTRDEWRTACERGYVTLQDGTPIPPKLE